MPELFLTIFFISILLFFLGSGVWVAISMIGVSSIGMLIFTTRPVGDAMATTIWGTSSSWTLTALPLFVWMGEILFRTKLSENLFIHWDHLKEIEKNGISIGAHSHTHRVLSSLSNKELIYELTESKRLLEEYLILPIESISYPVGGESTYHNSMFKLLDSLGYLVGFTFCKMVHRDISNNNYELGRISIDRPFDELFLKQMILTSPKL